MTHSTTLIKLEEEIKRQKELLAIGKYTEEVCEFFKRREEFEIPLSLWGFRRTEILFEDEDLFYGRLRISSRDVTHFLWMTKDDLFGAKRKEVERLKRILKIIEKALEDDGVDGAFGVVVNVIKDVLK